MQATYNYPQQSSNARARAQRWWWAEAHDRNRGLGGLASTGNTYFDHTHRFIQSGRLCKFYKRDSRVHWSKKTIVCSCLTCALVGEIKEEFWSLQSLTILPSRSFSYPQLNQKKEHHSGYISVFQYSLQHASIKKVYLCKSMVSHLTSRVVWQSAKMLAHRTTIGMPDPLLLSNRKSFSRWSNRLPQSRHDWEQEANEEKSERESGGRRPRRTIRGKERQRVAALSAQEETEETMDEEIRASEGAPSSPHVLWRKGGRRRQYIHIYRAGSLGHDMATPFIKGPGTLPRRTA